MGLLRLKKSRLRENLIPVYSKPFRGHRKGGARLFSEMYDDRTGGNGHELKYRAFWSGIRIKEVIVKVLKAWNRLPREDVKSLFLEVFNSIGQAPSSLAWLDPPWLEVWTRWPLEVPSRLNCSVIHAGELLTNLPYAPPPSCTKQMDTKISNSEHATTWLS